MERLQGQAQIVAASRHLAAEAAVKELLQLRLRPLAAQHKQPHASTSADAATISVCSVPTRGNTEANARFREDVVNHAGGVRYKDNLRFKMGVLASCSNGEKWSR